MAGDQPVPGVEVRSVRFPWRDVDAPLAGHWDREEPGPSTRTAADGSFLVMWRLGNVMGRWYDAYGVELGEAFTIGTTPAQGRPSVAVSGSGTAVVVWESPARRRSLSHVFAERLMVP